MFLGFDEEEVCIFLLFSLFFVSTFLLFYCTEKFCHKMLSEQTQLEENVEVMRELYVREQNFMRSFYQFLFEERRVLEELILADPRMTEEPKSRPTSECGTSDLSTLGSLEDISDLEEETIMAESDQREEELDKKLKSVQRKEIGKNESNNVENLENIQVKQEIGDFDTSWSNNVWKFENIPEEETGKCGLNNVRKLENIHVEEIEICDIIRTNNVRKFENIQGKENGKCIQGKETGKCGSNKVRKLEEIEICDIIRSNNVRKFENIQGKENGKCDSSRSNNFKKLRNIHVKEIGECDSSRSNKARKFKNIQKKEIEKSYTSGSKNVIQRQQQPSFQEELHDDFVIISNNQHCLYTIHEEYC